MWITANHEQPTWLPDLFSAAVACVVSFDGTAKEMANTNSNPLSLFPTLPHNMFSSLTSSTGRVAREMANTNSNPLSLFPTLRYTFSSSTSSTGRLTTDRARRPIATQSTGVQASYWCSSFRTGCSAARLCERLEKTLPFQGSHSKAEGSCRPLRPTASLLHEERAAQQLQSLSSDGKSWCSSKDLMQWSAKASFWMGQGLNRLLDHLMQNTQKCSTKGSESNRIGMVHPRLEQAMKLRSKQRGHLKHKSYSYSNSCTNWLQGCNVQGPDCSLVFWSLETRTGSDDMCSQKLSTIIIYIYICICIDIFIYIDLYIYIYI